MVDYSLTLSTVLHASFLINKMSGHEKALLVCAVVAEGRLSRIVETKDITSCWSKTALKSAYQSIFLQRAKDRNWITPVAKSQYQLTQVGLSHLDSIAKVRAPSVISATSSGLRLFRAGETHSFDKHLRQILLNSKTTVRIIDSYVDETIFDNLLDQIPKQARIRLLYGKSFNSFDQRELRFSQEYTRYIGKKNNKLHDRLLIADATGYILGPSLKDAAKNSSATLVKLSAADSEALIAFFDDLWKNS